MTEYEVSVSAYKHITVEADSAEEASERAMEDARHSSLEWTIDRTDPVSLESNDE